MTAKPRFKPGRRLAALAAGIAFSLAVAMPAARALDFDATGDYTVRGQNPGESGTYGAEISVKLVGEVYHLEWTSGGQKSLGVGLRLGDTLAVTWQDPETKESAIAVYIVMPDGGLKGRWAPFGADAAGTEDWTRKP